MQSQHSVMKSKSRCDWFKPKLCALCAVAFLFTLSLYYPGQWNFRRYNKGFLASRLSTAGFFRRYETTPTPAPADVYDPAEETSALVLDTVGCKIPNMRVGFVVSAAREAAECGERVLRLRKVNGTHAQFESGADPLRCTYRFARRADAPGKEDREIRYSPGINFSTPITFKLESDFIKVSCTRANQTDVHHDDAFAVVRKLSQAERSGATGDATRGATGGATSDATGGATNDATGGATSGWNVLILGMDTMSRGRTLDTMLRTVAYFRKHRWIDFRGYQKVGDNTWPNLMAMLTGKKRTTVDRACRATMDECRRMLIWSKYRELGYATAYAEDYLPLPDTFSTRGFKRPPTEHYMRPFFLTGERIVKSGDRQVVCTGAKPSGHHVLDYARDFAETYTDDRFFGFFWINSNSHNMANEPEAIDGKLESVLEDLERRGTLNDTFVVFLSDHGVRFGEKRISMPSYYEERLPAFFMWAPIAFRKDFSKEYDNLVSNRHRLVTPYDLYLTLEDILEKSVGCSEPSGSEACPGCQSLFGAIPSERTCADAAVEPKWCSCHSMTQMASNDTEGVASVNFVLDYIRSFSAKLETNKCTQCKMFSLHNIMRMHYYYNRDDSVKYVVVAFMVVPGMVGYEATVSCSEGKYEIVGQISIISPHFGKGWCVKKKSVSMYCYCGKTKKCS